MDENRMVPRIVVADDSDAELIAAALCMHLHTIWAKVTISGDIDGCLDASRRGTELLAELVDSARSRQARDTFGPLPSDEDMAEQLEKMRDGFGETRG